MSDTEFTQQEYEQFCHLSSKTSSSDQVTRINGRLKLREFIQQHGKGKCDAMWAKLTASEPMQKRMRAN
jgi:hypothetical protein